MGQLIIQNYAVDIIDEPLETLSLAERDRIIEECIPVARRGFGNDGVTKSDIETHAVEVSTGIYIRDPSGTMVAFGGSVVEPLADRLVAHLKGTAILPEHQGKGLYKLITPLRALSEVSKNGSDILIGSRTQNPRVLEYLSGRLGTFPSPEGSPDDEIADLAERYARMVMEKHSDPSRLAESRDRFAFDRNTFVVKGAYAGSMYGVDIPSARDGRFNDFVASQVDFARGDAFILLGRFDPVPYFRELRSMLSGSLLQKAPENDALERRVG